MAAFERAFDIEIDNYVFIGFQGVTGLISAVGGVDVRLQKSYYDPYYWVNSHTRGWGLPAGKSHLNAQRALIFARSRKGDSDFGRARRQQLLVMAAFDKVRKRGLDDLPKLIRSAKDSVRTDLPLSRANDLFKLYKEVDLKKAKRAVFGPKSFAVRAHGYTYHLVYARVQGVDHEELPEEAPVRDVAGDGRSGGTGRADPGSGCTRTDPGTARLLSSRGSDRSRATPAVQQTKTPSGGTGSAFRFGWGECGLVPEGRPESP